MIASNSTGYENNAPIDDATTDRTGPASIDPPISTRWYAGALLQAERPLLPKQLRFRSAKPLVKERRKWAEGIKLKRMRAA
jgi:hypothetical protein